MSDGEDDNPIRRTVLAAVRFTTEGEPAAAGADVHAIGDWTERLNERYAVVKLGSRVMILDERRGSGAPPEFLTVEAFGTWMSNQFVERRKGSGGGVEAVPVSTLWMRDGRRRQYEGVGFEPFAPGEPDPIEDGTFNLWRGFAVEPDPAGDPGAFFDHLMDNVCGGSQELYDWLLAFFGHMIQRPRERVATALALRGRMGTGKSIVGEIIGQLFPAHYYLVDDPRYVVGNFNAHLRACLLMQVDEGFWAGDKQAEARLKSLISSETTMVELKGVDPIQVANRVRLMVTSNDDWMVPAGKEERRWAVYDVGDGRIRDGSYFAALKHAMRQPGALGGLLHQLMHVSLVGVDLRDVPAARALFEQKTHNLSPFESWWLERLRDGSQLPGEGVWRDFVPTSRLLRSYRTEAEAIGARRKATEIEFGHAFNKAVPRLKRVKRLDIDDAPPGGANRVWGYVFPPLAEARAAFAEAMRSEIDWDAGEE
ncbi:DUF5906 domain-containing protein [Pseudoxanthobacter sp. M-2]|uniref:primase-helicase family protein n=1 Tax=Pseudoxanthobacter sp. M-2 TaxID=3078754 RepID=UPI0038FD2C5A